MASYQITQGVSSSIDFESLMVGRKCKNKSNNNNNNKTKTTTTTATIRVVPWCTGDQDREVAGSNPFTAYYMAVMIYTQ